MRPYRLISVVLSVAAFLTFGPVAVAAVSNHIFDPKWLTVCIAVQACHVGWSLVNSIADRRER